MESSIKFANIWEEVFKIMQTNLSTAYKQTHILIVLQNIHEFQGDVKVAGLKC